MSDVEKGFESCHTMPPPSYHSHAGDRNSNFQGPYEAFVNDNMRQITGNAGRPAQTFDADLPKRESKFSRKQRLALGIASGCLLILVLAPIGFLVHGRHGKDGRDGKDGNSAELRTVTAIATPTTSSSSSASVSVSVSIKTTTATTLSRTTKHATTTVVTTASTPQSILDAASSYYDALSEASVAATRNPGTMAEPPTPLPSSATTTVMETAEAKTLLGAVTVTTTSFALPTTPVAPPPEPTTTDELRTLPNFINFCGVPGQACG